jgi:hypothetical protein
MIVFISSYVFTSVLYVVIKLLATIVTILCPNASSIMYRFLRFNSMVLGTQRLEKAKCKGPKNGPGIGLFGGPTMRLLLGFVMPYIVASSGRSPRKNKNVPLTLTGVHK